MAVTKHDTTLMEAHTEVRLAGFACIARVDHTFCAKKLAQDFYRATGYKRVRDLPLHAIGLAVDFFDNYKPGE